MTKLTLPVLLLAVFAIDPSTSLQQNYYWRDYTGIIPSDAVAGGKDINGNDVYIGQAYIKNRGLFVAQIYSATKEVYTTVDGVHLVKDFVKILCGPQENFYWLPTNSTALPLLLIGRHAVIGGHEDSRGLISIGRVGFEGEIVIGKVNSFNTQDAQFYYRHRHQEKALLAYELLLYNNHKNYEEEEEGNDIKLIGHENQL